MRKQAKEVKARIKKNKLRLKEERIKMIEVLTEQNKVSTIVPELIVEDFSSNPDYRKCTSCLNYKLLTEYYKNNTTGYYQSKCKRCNNDYANGKLKDYYQTKYETRGGSERVLHKPGEFMDIYQEKQVSWLLELIGWSKDGDIWVKEGIKTVQDGNIVWDKIIPTPKVKKDRKKPTPKRTYNINKIIELRNNGLTILEIAGIMGCSKPTIRKLLLKGNEEAKGND